MNRQTKEPIINFFIEGITVSPWVRKLFSYEIRSSKICIKKICTFFFKFYIEMFSFKSAGSDYLFIASLISGLFGTPPPYSLFAYIHEFYIKESSMHEHFTEKESREIGQKIIVI